MVFGYRLCTSGQEELVDGHKQVYKDARIWLEGHIRRTPGSVVAAGDGWAVEHEEVVGKNCCHEMLGNLQTAVRGAFRVDSGPSDRMDHTLHGHYRGREHQAVAAADGRTSLDSDGGDVEVDNQDGVDQDAAHKHRESRVARTDLGLRQTHLRVAVGWS